MSKISQGILGGFSGKTGSVVGSTWKGKSVMRGLPQFKKTRKVSAYQMEQREKFKLIINFLSGMSDLLAVTYKKQASGISGINAAVSYNIRYAITDTASPFSIDYNLVQFGYGNSTMPNGNQPSAIALPGNEVEFSWINNAGAGKAKAQDTALLVIYCPALNQSFYIKNGPLRSAESALVDLGIFTGETVETWILFLSEDESIVSRTAYTGSITLIP